MAKKRMTLKEFERVKKLNEERLQDLEFCSSLICRAQELSKFLSKVEPEYRSRDDYEYNFPFKYIEKILSDIRWSFPVKTEKVFVKDTDRRHAILLGPIFTSEKYPWPCQGGRFREPIAQFDLDWVGKLANVPLGTGILQLWLGPSFDEYEIRIIPVEDFHPALIAPIPKSVDRSYFTESPFFAGDYGSWLDGDSGGEAVLITGTGKPTLTWHSGLYDGLEDLAFNMDDENASLITQFLELLPQKSPSPTPHFFGISAPIQYDAIDMPPCLLALDSNGPFASGWGDSGNAQIFYIIHEDGSVDFDFQWSCP